MFTDFLNTYNQAVQQVAPSRTVYEKAVAAFPRVSPQQQEEILVRMLFMFPNDATLYNKMGTFFKDSQPLRALMWYKLAFQHDPRDVENTADLSKMLFDNGLSEHVLALDPSIIRECMGNPKFLGVYARCNFQKLRYANGVSYLLKLIELQAPVACTSEEDRLAKWSNYHDIGYVFCALARVDEAIQYTDKATDLANKFGLPLPKRLLSFSNLVSFHGFKYQPDQTALFKRYLEINTYLPNKTSFAFQKRKGNAKLRVGYVSSDFVYHAVANFLLPILKQHTHSKKVEAHLFPNVAKMVPEFENLDLPTHSIVNLSDKDAAALIYKQKIDVLIDLNGHSVHNRLGIFALNPAPIQVAYLGYPNTTGLKGIRYRITDGVADPENTQEPYSEKLVRLPSCFLLFESIHQTTPVVPQKTAEQVILAAINKENKNSEQALATWKTILASCPRATLLIKLETFDNTEERRSYYSAKLDVPSSRLIIVNKQFNDGYVDLFKRIDVLLDPYPYSGTTTTCNALYNSIPVVTLKSPNCHAQNVTTSLLTHCGLEELVAATPEEYVAIVARLVSDPDAIDAYKASIHGKFQQLMNPERFVKSYEDLLLSLT